MMKLYRNISGSLEYLVLHVVVSYRLSSVIFSANTKQYVDLGENLQTNRYEVKKKFDNVIGPH